MSKIYSIVCPNCAAPLALLGGGKVKTVTCKYCKSVIDLEDNYKIVANFASVKNAHEIPFEIGQKGKIDEVEYVIIGRVDYEENRLPYEVWSELLLYNKIYGYCWLIYSNGTVEFSRRYRALPSVTFDELNYLSNLHIDNIDYKKYYRYTADVCYVEGELTYIAKAGDRVEIFEYMSPPNSISIEKSKYELEGYKGKLLDIQETYDAFNVPLLNQFFSKETFHPLKPFSKPTLKLIKNAAILFLSLVVLLSAMFYYSGYGKKIRKNVIVNAKTTKYVKFNIEKDNYLTEITLYSPQKSTLYKSKLALFDNADNGIKFRLLNAVGEFKGDVVGKVTYDATKIRIDLKLPKSNYSLKVKNLHSSAKIRVDIKEGVSRLNYLEILATILVIFIAIYYIALLSYKSKYKNNSDFSDENDTTDFSIGSIFSAFMQILFVAIVLYTLFTGEYDD